MWTMINPYGMYRHRCRGAERRSFADVGARSVPVATRGARASTVLKRLNYVFIFANNVKVVLGKSPSLDTVDALPSSRPTTQEKEDPKTYENEHCKTCYDPTDNCACGSLMMCTTARILTGTSVTNMSSAQLYHDIGLVINVRWTCRAR